MITIENWMSTPVYTVNPDDSTLSAIKVMVKKNIGDVVVINAKNVPIGIITERDILSRVILSNKSLEETKVKSIMTKNLKTATVGATFLEISRLMERGGFRRIPITKNGKIVGIVTSRDLVRFMSL